MKTKADKAWEFIAKYDCVLVLAAGFLIVFLFAGDPKPSAEHGPPDLPGVGSQLYRILFGILRHLF